MTEKYDLSRRKVLAGLGTIGVAGAGAGMGTVAYFSDEESFEDNQFTAGTLDMEVTAEVAAVSDEYPDAEGTVDFVETADGDVVTGYQFADVKPGDWFLVCYQVDIGENPGYVTIHAENFGEGENGLTEPEGDVDESPDDGELDEKLLVEYWENWDESTGDRTGLNTLDNITNAASPDLYEGNWKDPNEEGVISTGSDEPDVEYTNVREFFFGRNGDPSTKPSSNDPLGAGFASGDGILVGGTSNPVRVGATDNIGRRRLSDPDEDGASELVFYLLFELPEEVGNEVQGDSVSFDLRFSTEQVRHNDDPRSGRWSGY